jgi:oligogalacturonide lyase
MRSEVRLVPLLCAVSVLASADDRAAPREWIESTGHRVVRLSDEPGSASLYFHQNAYTASGDKLLISTPGGLATVDLVTRRIDSVVAGRVSQVVVGPRTRQVFYMKDGTVYATHLDTRATRAIVTWPELRSGSGLAVNADETLLAGSYVEGGGAGRTAPETCTARPTCTPSSWRAPRRSEIELDRDLDEARRVGRPRAQEPPAVRGIGLAEAV